MEITPALLPKMVEAIADTIEQNADEVTALDQAIGDGDHVTNLQRGIEAVKAKSSELSRLDWAAALQKIGMTLLSTMGGASGSLFGTLFISMSKAVGDQPLNSQTFASVFSEGVEAVKKRGKAQAGEKTMLDVLIPASDSLQQAASESTPLGELLEKICQTAIAGMESTRDMVATKGRASFLEERSKGHIDAGAKTSQLMICAIADVVKEAARR
jgi:phosphoenolpyruvate---glycerone phosphotransferase subunit DhaL